MSLSNVNKRKSAGNQNGSPQPHKKFIKGGFLNPNADTPPKTPNAQQKQASSAKKPQQKSPASSLQKFAGTTKLDFSTKREGIPKSPIADGAGQRKQRRKARRTEIRNKDRELAEQAKKGDKEARQVLQGLIQKLANKPDKSKTAKRRLAMYRRWVTPTDGSKMQKVAKPQQKESNKLQLNHGGKVLVKSKPQQVVKQIQPPQKGQQSNKKGIKQVTKVESEESEEESNDEEDEESSGDAEEASGDAEEASSDEEEASADEEEASADEEETSGDDEKASGDEEESSDAESSEEQVEVKAVGKKQPIAKKNENNTKPAATQGNVTKYVVFVGNLPFTAKHEKLKQHFEKVGDIVDVRIPTEAGTNKPRGFAYVELKNQDGYERALSLHHSFFEGRQIKVEYTQSGTKKTPERKAEIKAKNFKLRAMGKEGLLAGSVKHDQKRSVRRAKMQNFEKGAA